MSVAPSLLPRVAAGEQGAVRDFIDLYGGLVWSIALRFSPTAADAEDAVQEIFIKLWKTAPRFNPSLASEDAFVAMVARRHLIDRYRKRESRPRLEPFKADFQAPVDNHHHEIERGLEASIALSSISEMHPRVKEVLLMSIYFGMSHGEIASATSLPLGTVKTHILRGMRSLRDRFRTVPSDANQEGATGE